MSATTTPRTRLRSALLLAAATELVVLGGASLTAFLTASAGRSAWVAAPAAAVLVGLAKVLLTRVAEPAEEQPPAQHPPQQHPPASYPAQYPPRQPLLPRPSPPARRRRRGTPVAVAALVVLLLVGGGGVALAVGVRTLVGALTGDETGVERLAAPVAASDSGLTLTVTGVEHTPRYTRVEAVVTSELAVAVELPVVGNVHLAEQGRRTLEASTFRSDIATTVPPRGELRGTLVFAGHASDGATTVTVGYARVFAQGFEGPDAIAVSVPLTGLP